MPWINRPKKTVRTTVERRDSKYYNKPLWKNLRKAYLMTHPLCECPRCVVSGRRKLAEEVHHKVPFMTGRTDEERRELCYDWTNLMAVSKECHIEIHRNLKKSKKNV